MSSPPVATAPPRPRTSPPTSSVADVAALLRTPLRVSVADGRVFLGTFAGTDKQLNVLLVNTDEYRVGPDAGAEGAGPRYVGQVMVPWRLVVRVEARGARAETGDGDGAAEDMDVGGEWRDSDEDSMYT
ncbi:uncharacterized protein BXZ73DRAFT_44101 [Epithele typhae]|uniref:uncharacterized protein n=1 Tax=Epithele typhae TaxID=378194 RepID=UPI002008170B|nr:uncharacterized protein BXZ73DRAFT_44101 [Epithele typhae]KAH9938997.1 hypothetical protein BXZ73DRAFT_44101 [Epithele typhae]